MTRDEFLVYLNLLSSNKDHDRINEFITDDITLEFYNGVTLEEHKSKVLHGRGEYIAHFKALHAKIREFLDLGFFLCDGKNAVVELYVEFHALEDSDSALSAGKLEKGKAYCATHWVCYDLTPEGKFSRVRIAHHMSHYTPPIHDPRK